MQCGGLEPRRFTTLSLDQDVLGKAFAFTAEVAGKSNVSGAGTGCVAFEGLPIANTFGSSQATCSGFGTCPSAPLCLQPALSTWRPWFVWWKSCLLSSGLPGSSRSFTLCPSRAYPPTWRFQVARVRCRDGFLWQLRSLRAPSNRPFDFHSA